LPKVLPNDVPQVPNVFPKGVPNNTALLSHVVCLKFSATYIGGPQGREAPHLHIDRKFLFWRAFKVSAFLLFLFGFCCCCDGSIKMAHCRKKKKKKKGTWEAPSSIYEGR
jgi:hypothetical protein